MLRRAAFRALTLTALLLLPECLPAQSEVATTADLSRGVPIRLRSGGSWFNGSLVAVTPDSIALANEKSGSTQTYSLTRISDLSYSAGKKSMIVRGAAIGALGGAAAAGGMLLISNVVMPSDEGWTGSTSGWAVVGISAGVGAALGALFGAARPQERWVTVQVPRAQPVIVPARNGVVVGVSLRF